MARVTRWAAPAAILAVALAAGGCGGGDGSASQAATTAVTVTDQSPGSAGTLTISGGPRAGSYGVTFCIADGGSNLTLSASGNDQKVDVEASGGSGSLLVANTANTELTNGTVDVLTVTGDGSITASGTYTDGTTFALKGTCTG